jgi:penicillin-binding protein 1A
MIPPDLQPADAAQQYFPTYRVPAEKVEVTLREYDLSAQALSADQRSISVATGLAVIGISFSGTLIGSDRAIGTLKAALGQIGHVGEALVFAIVFGVTLLVLRYFAELQRSATYAARKIVVLRRLLGIDYGNRERVFPTDRIEGANEPFAIAMFPGWGSIGPLAAAVIAAFCGIVLAVLLGTFAEQSGSLSSRLLGAVGDATTVLATLAIATAAFALIIYRCWLLESWEAPRFLAGVLTSKEVGVPLKARMGHVLYRLELSVHEAKRIGILLEGFIPILLAVEDKRFFSHNGNDWFAVARAVRNYWKYKARSGGSTIDQQLFRSNCLARLDRSLWRKPVEWVMAPWIRARFGADQVIRMYLCSVRFDRGVFGVAAAATHFFDLEFNSASNWVPTKAEVFFLVDRLSNVSRTIPTARIRARLAALIENKLIAAEDVEELKQLYLDQIGKGHISGTVADLDIMPTNTSSAAAAPAT